MKTTENEILSDLRSSTAIKNRFFKAHLNKNSFRGFWYDTQDRSYGIKLSFNEKNSNMLNLYAQDSKGEMIVFEYEIRSDTIHIEQISYDKVLIATSEYAARIVDPKEGELKIPANIELSIQLLSHNSIYIHFTDSLLYSPPINKLHRGLVLAREYK